MLHVGFIQLKKKDWKNSFKYGKYAKKETTLNPGILLHIIWKLVLSSYIFPFKKCRSEKTANSKLFWHFQASNFRSLSFLSFNYFCILNKVPSADIFAWNMLWNGTCKSRAWSSKTCTCSESTTSYRGFVNYPCFFCFLISIISILCY